MKQNTLTIIAAFWSLFAAVATAADPDMGDHPGFAHAMQVETRVLDGYPVVFHYGQVRPDFSDRTRNPHRKVTSLDGDWRFRFDSGSTGTDGRWFSPDIATAGWKTVRVPHCWDAMPGGRYWDWGDRSVSNPPHYNGVAWYRKEFDWQPAQAGGITRRQRLTFLNVQQRARIYLNGKQVALHEGGGAPFSVDISDHLTPGSNTLALKVLRLPNFRKKDNGKDWKELFYTHTMHPKAPDCWPYAGILGSVGLVEEPEVSIRKCQITTKKREIKHAVIISNHGKQPHRVRVATRYSCGQGKSGTRSLVTIAPGQSHVVKITSQAQGKITRWSPATPVIYHALTTLHDDKDQPIDQLRTTFGFRTFTVTGPLFQLNGADYFLKGASIYSEHHARGGALLKADHEHQFELLRDSRCNFIRAHVSQRDPYFYQLADQRGLLVCGEWGGFWYREQAMKAQTEDPYSIYQSMARCAVWDLMNHPSVVMWGLNNECHQFCPEYAPFLKMARELVHEIDFTKRPITWAAWHPHMGQPHFEYADAVGFNEYRGAMDPFEKLEPDIKTVIRRNPGKPLIIMENGAWAVRGKRGHVRRKGTEDWQADLLRRQWDVLSRYSPPFAGYTYWLLTDYRSRKPYTGRKTVNGYSRMGVYDEYGKAKLVRDTFRNLRNPLKKQTPAP